MVRAPSSAEFKERIDSFGESRSIKKEGSSELKVKRTVF